MLTLLYHPLSSFCWKVLIALYERAIPFTPQLVDLSTDEGRAAFERIWGIGKFPVLQDTATGLVLPESSIIIEYLDGLGTAPRMIPAGADGLQARLWDRFYDHYIHQQMQTMIGDRLRPAEAKEPQGVADARAMMLKAYGIANATIAGRRWAAGDAFGLADCAAAPALHYANRVIPIAPAYPALADYLARLEARPAFARTLEEAAPYRHMFPE